MKTKFIVILFGVLAISCSEHGPGKGPSERGLLSKADAGDAKTMPVKDTAKAVALPAVKDTTTFDRTYDDIARYIAGVKQMPGSNLTSLEKDTVWIKYAAKFDKEWEIVVSKRLKPMSDWANTELADEHKQNPDVFYPLSGPDILHANAFFPKARHYHLYALERAGKLPDVKHMKTKEMEGYLTDVYTSLSDVFTKSYFITHKMLTDLQKENVNGTLSLICIFLVRSNHKVINVRYCHLNDDGTESYLNKDSAAVHSNDYVKVYFKSNDDTTMQVLTYMKCDLADKGLTANKGLTAFINKMPKSITYLKSASYLLHYKFFTVLRDAILDKSITILEDDTGIPYKYFGKDKWNVSLYGSYVKPVSDFSGVFQDDLMKVYHDSTSADRPKKLPFSLGYHWGTSNQNLLKATHKG
jgi:hypothetical protein